MERYNQHERPPTRRQPLGDATLRVNNLLSSTPPRRLEPLSSSSPHMPHHESLKPNGILQLRDTPGSPATNAENKRLSAITSEDKTKSNRNSQISTTSTNASGKSRRKTHVGPWQLGKTLGKGATGRVRLAKHALTGQFAAIKIVSKKSAALVQSTSLSGMDTMVTGPPVVGSNGGRLMPFGIEKEVVIMKLIEHPNIINLYDVWENRGELWVCQLRQ